MPVLGPFLFLIYSNDVHNTIKFSQALSFPYDQNLLNIQNKIPKINNALNEDFEDLSFWQNANKKPCDKELRLKLCRKIIYKTNFLIRIHSMQS